ncbi:MAG: SPOR domain-containing protein, partial [Marinomonas gallaica]
GAFSYFESLHNGRAWFVVVYGEYRNRSEAIAAVENLPNGLRSLNPWARSVRGIQQDIRKAGAQ